MSLLDRGQARVYAIEQLKLQGLSNFMPNETDAQRIRKSVQIIGYRMRENGLHRVKYRPLAIA